MRTLWINNQWSDATSDDTIAVIDPATEKVVDRVPAATPKDVDRAVAAARAAFPAWRKTPANQRAALLHEAARRMRDMSDELAVTLTHETGRLLARNYFYAKVVVVSVSGRWRIADGL